MSRIAKMCPDVIKPYVFYGLKWAYQTCQGIEPLRNVILMPLKKANRWLGYHDKRTGRYKVRNYPDTVTIQMMKHCNLACPMCFRQNMPPELLAKEESETLSIDDFRKIGEQIFPYVKLVNISLYGEPLLVPHLDEIIKILAYYKCKLEIYSNGTPLVSDKLMDLIFPYIETLWISMDGATKETFEKIRKGAKFESVVRALERFGRLKTDCTGTKPRFGFNINIQRDNVKELPDIVRLAAHVHADIVQGDHVFVLSPSTRDLRIDHEYETYHIAYEEACRLGKELGIEVYLRPPQPGLQSKKPDTDPVNSKPKKIKKDITNNLDCSWLWNKIIIDYNGQSVPCCHPKPPRLPGNVIQDFWGVWDGPLARAIRRDYLTDQAPPCCKNCYMLRGRDTVWEENDVQYNLEDEVLASTKTL